MTILDLKGRAAVVTGGLGDLGTAICEQLAGRGAAVHIFDLLPPVDAQESLARLSETAGIEAKYEQLDVRDYPAMEAAIGSIPDLYAVVGNAGIGIMTPFLEMTPELWDEEIGINLTGCFNTGLAAARRLANTGGCIIFISSWIGTVPWPGMAAYCASKGGLEMLTKTMARDLAPNGIRVNAVAPGIVDAGPSKRIMSENAEFLRATQNVIPVGRLQRAEEVGSAVGFLIGDQSSYITGSILTTDGGCSLFQYEASKD